MYSFERSWYKPWLFFFSDFPILSNLKKSHSEYRELQVKAMRIVEENPALRILINSMEGIVLTPEDHKALHKYIETKDEMTIFEYEYYYLAGQIMTFSYGRMLAQLKNEMLNEDSGTSTHLIELLTSIRSDELEKQLLDESEEYQNCIKEEENSEAEVKSRQGMTDTLPRKMVTRMRF